MTRKIRTLIHLSPALLGFAGAILAGVILLPESQYHLYFGGTVCDTTRGIVGCVGYPPTGIIFVGLVLSMALQSHKGSSGTRRPRNLARTL